MGWLQGNPWFMSVIITASSVQRCDNRCLATDHISLVGSCFLVLISKTILLVGGGCNFLGSVLPQQKFEMTDGSVLQLGITAQFYLVSKGKYILKAWGRADPRDVKRSRRPNFGSSFYVFLLPLSLPYVKQASQEGCLLYLRFSLWSLDLPLFYFHRLCPSLSFSHLFPVLTT